VGTSFDRGNEYRNSGGSPGEPGRQRDQQPSVVIAVGDVLSGYSGEVDDILGKEDIATGNRGSEYVGICVAGEPESGNGGRVNAGGLQATGQRGGIHLIEQELHRASAAAVSLRCKSMRAWISSG
jgi:hypothetical protein